MFINLLSLATTPSETIGALYIDGVFECFTLEDPFQIRKIPGISRIPEGRYRVTLRTEGGWHIRERQRYGDRHKGMLWLRDVPDFEHILIHPGNSPTDTEGCLLVGDDVYRLGNGQRHLRYSRAAYERLYPKVADAILAGDVFARISRYG